MYSEVMLARHQFGDVCSRSAHTERNRFANTDLWPWYASREHPV